MTESARWLVPEVVQTSAMDCGPAALKCLLEGFGIPVSYDRLREACQTDVDGTSIDTLEVVANQLGLEAEQVMLPLDHLFLEESQALPAIAVVRHKDGATHFVVVWRRHGRWLQVMDPAVGRRWLPASRFADELYRHSLSVPATGWREWAQSPEYAAPLLHQLSRIGATPEQAKTLLDRALADPLWYGPAVLDASVRFALALIQVGGLRPGAQTLDLVSTLFVQTFARKGDIFQDIPPKYWAVEPDFTDGEGTLHLQLHGAVLIKVKGVRAEAAVGTAADAPAPAPSADLLAALKQEPTRPLRTLWTLLREDGILGPWVMAGAMGIAAAVVLIELLLFRGLFDIAWALNLPSQRLLAMLALMAFLVILLLIEVPLLTEAMRYGRHLDTRLRMALLARLPHLSDRYFQSRPVSDMADRSHSIHLARMVPGFGLQVVQLVCDLAFTLLGIALIDQASVPLALLIAGTALLIPALLQPVLNERDLRMRNHSGALHVFNLDALLGLVPIRTHGAERVVRRQHEGLLVEWTRAGRSLIHLSLGAQALQSLLCLGLVATLLWTYFSRVGGTSGADLLLTYWALKLPAVGQGLIALAQQYPAQRNVLLRLLEPLHTSTESTGKLVDAPNDVTSTPGAPPPPNDATFGMALEVRSGKVVAAGHTLLQGLDITIQPGEHVAIVGASGAGKSTLLGLLLGWHRLAEGELLIDGEALTPSGQEALRQHCAWVDPGIQIWNQSFLDNLTYACEVDRSRPVGAVLDRANLRSVLQKLPQGLQSYLGEGGALLSGGEGQRVRLARALMQPDVRLALLDEPFRGLDRTQRHALLSQCLQWWGAATVLCVTHDVAETLSFGRVLVVDGGQILEDGPPAQLAATGTRYRALLEAEREVHEAMWQSAAWRRIHIDGLQA